MGQMLIVNVRMYMCKCCEEIVNLTVKDCTDGEEIQSSEERK